MADTFISYARDDRTRVQVLTDAITAEGWTVWWDPDMQAGKPWPPQLRDEITKSAAVVTVWTSAAAESRWVLEETMEAERQEKLITIAMDDDAVPFGFRSFHAEDFRSWSGDKAATCWRRFKIQLEAAIAARGRPGEADGPKPAQPRSSPWAIFLLAALSLLAAGLLAIPALRAWPGAAALSTAVAAALFFQILFLQAERLLPPHTKALIKAWLLPDRDPVPVNLAEAFLAMFEAVFGRRHLSWLCFWRSALASTLSVVLLLTILEFTLTTQFGESYFQQELQYQTALARGDAAAGWRGFLGSVAPILALLVILPNIIGDYLSLGETRLVLRVLRRRPGLLMPLVLLDIVLTSAIFLVLLMGVNFAAGVWQGDLRVADIPGQLMTELLGIAALILTFFMGTVDNTHGAGLFIAAFLTSFITSVWLWLVLALTPLFRLLAWTGSGMRGLGRVLNGDEAPVAALGALIAILIVLGGVVLAGLQAWEAMI